LIEKAPRLGVGIERRLNQVFAIQPSSGRNEIAAFRMGSGIYIQVGETLLLLEVVM
jgi:hypothetical protein